MIILDKPYVSIFLQKTLCNMDIPVLNLSNDRTLLATKDLNIVNENEFIEISKTKSPLLLYCNSENSIQWIYENPEYNSVSRAIELFKDKLMFRKSVKDIYPNFLFKEISYDQLAKFDTSKISKPFIIKPAIGFFSMGVYKVSEDNQWGSIVGLIQDEMDKVKGLYPTHVLDSSKFIVEEYIEGEEFAIDAYYDCNGYPVILNILQHPFSSDEDVSDRVYFTSKQIIRRYLNIFRDVLIAIGKATGITNFPLHIEVRVDKNENVIPIEINPMRFAGWCTTDLAHYAYGINVYEHYFNQIEPDWDQILNNNDNLLYCIVVADIPKVINLNDIRGIDYEAYASNFSNLLELRKINYKQYPVFAFSFISVDCDSNEVNRILKMDLKKYITLIKDK